MSTLSEVRIYVTFLTYLGLHKSAGHKRLFYFSNAMQLLFLFVLIALISNGTIFYYTDGSLTSKLMDFTQNAIVLVNHLVQILEAMHKGERDEQMLKLIEQIEELEGDYFQVAHSARHCSAKCLITILSIEIFALLPEWFIVGSIYKSRQPWIRSFSSRMLSSQFVRFNLFYRTLYVWVVWAKLRRMQAECNAIEQNFEKWPRVVRESMLSDRLLVLKKCMELLKRVSLVSADRCSVALLFTMLSYFLTTTISFYYVISRLIYKIPGIIESSLCIVPLISTLVVICWVCDTCKHEYKNLGPALHKLIKYSSQYEPNSFIRRLSIQVQSTNFNVTAHNFFSIDFNMLKNICYAITTYLVVFISMNQSEGKY